MKSNLGILLLVLLIAGLAHGYNMFHYPYYENDEGTYVSQAWSLVTQNKLAPYTYWYDHAPAGWMLIGLWAKLTGGFFTFGTSVNSGRMLMLVLHVATAALLFYIAKRFDHSNVSGLIAVLIFSLSPLAIYFQRRVLLDNIMIFWVLLSLALLVKQKFRLHNAVFSAAALGIAVLTKENAVFFVPALLYLIWVHAKVGHRRVVFVVWLAVFASVVSMYFLYALLKGELLPAPDRVSLLETLLFQLDRGSGYPFWHPQSDFYLNLNEWLMRDRWTVITGGVATIVAGLLSVKVKYLRVPFGLAVLFWVFLMRGSLVINFYVVPLIPLLALIVGLLMQWFTKQISSYVKQPKIAPYMAIIFAAFLLQPMVMSSTAHWQRDETTSQVMAMEWLKENVDAHDFIIIDNSLYVDLHDQRFENDKVLDRAEWSWKVEKDPEVSARLEKGWQSVDYLALTHEMLKQMRTGEFPLSRTALANSDLQAEWKDAVTTHVDVENLESTNGDWVSIYKLREQNDAVLSQSWQFYKNNFIHSYGQVIDPQNGQTTSEGQSYAMLRAVIMNDEEAFKGLWSWTRDHLQTRIDDKLFAWLWLSNERGGFVADAATATDADEDIALALLLAYRVWGEEEYLTAARAIIDDIWEYEVVEIGSHYYVVAGKGGQTKDGYLVNPSYYAPFNYRIFALVDQDHPWSKLVLDSYWFLDKISNSEAGLPMNWLVVDDKTGAISSASSPVKLEADWYGFDAFRVHWRVALDAKLFGDRRAVDWLHRTDNFLLQEWRDNNSFAAIYDQAGKRVVPYSALSVATGAWAALYINYPAEAEKMFEQIFQNHYREEGYWGDEDNYYDQNWVWLSAALRSQSLLRNRSIGTLIEGW